LHEGFLLSVLLLTGGLALSVWFGFGGIVLLYAATSIAYSVRLKEMPLVDVFMLAGLYTIRLVAGGIATGHLLTMWLFNVSAFSFLSLAMLKRVGELQAVVRSPGQAIPRRGYLPSDMLLLQMCGSGAAFASCVMLALFVQSDTTVTAYHSPFLLWGLVPLLLFWQCRLWLATTRGQMHDDPIVFAARDRVSWLVGGAILVLLFAAKTGLVL
jgi:4-hydroxybenzoate polyprenyltransferase